MRLLRLLLRLSAVLAVLVLAGAVALFFWLRTSLPDLEGEVAVAGTASTIEILRDGAGIPHIFADSPADAYFGLGFVHAQDRMFQMEQQRRLSQGRLSELLGGVTLDVDRFLRMLGLHRAARASVRALGTQARKSLEAYAAGVNAFLATHEGASSPGFALMFAGGPEPWTPADSLAWLKTMALSLAGNWREEALRAAMTARMGADKATSFFPGAPTDMPPTVGDSGGTAFARLRDALAILPGPMRGASNNWAVNGGRTASGRPLLANDPHLGLTIPAVWYLARLEAPGLSVAGATLPGMPLVVVGTNGEIAWSVSNTGPDTQDIFIERLDPGNPGRYLTPDGTESFAVREETIAVRFADDETVPVRETRHGPVLTGIVGRADELAGDGEVAALAWTMLQNDDRSMEAGLAIHTAHSWEDLVAAGRNYAGPMQTIIYADRHGNIGLMAPGAVPLRRSGDGLLPAAGWTGESDWIGHVPHDDLPRVLNPDSGLIAAANDRLVGPDYAYLLSHRWEPGYRARRIREALRARDKHDLGSFTALQRDLHSGFAADFLPHARAARPAGSAGRRLQEHLAGWEGEMGGDLVAPTVFHAWYRELTRSIYRDDLGELFEDAWWYRPVFTLGLFDDDPHGWCSDSLSGAAATCAELAGAAFDSAAAFLSERFGDEPAAWTWGRVHALDLSHSLFGHVPGLDALTDIEIPLGGERHTVAQGRLRVRR